MSNTSFKDFLKTSKRGTYACLKLDDESRDKIARFITLHNVFNGVSATDLHSTVIYSRVFCPNMISRPVDITAQVVGTQLIKDGDKTCLAIELKSDAQKKLHMDLRSEHGATHDFDDYLQHITLSYDIGNFNIPDVSTIGEVKFDKLEVMELDIDA